MEAEIDRQIKRIRDGEYKPEWSLGGIAKGVVMLTPVGGMVWPEEKPVFDRVWARRREWIHGRTESGSDDEKEGETIGVPGASQ